MYMYNTCVLESTGELIFLVFRPQGPSDVMVTGTFDNVFSNLYLLFSYFTIAHTLFYHV